MESQLPQDSSDVSTPRGFLEPVTAELSEARAPDAAVQELESTRDDASDAVATPPPSDQTSSVNRHKTRTPTPPVSHISTPPPTVEAAAPTQTNGYRGDAYVHLSPEELTAASSNELRSRITDLQVALRDAATSAAHHKLQYQMLAQESAASIERMAVEAKMAQSEDEVIHHAEQTKAAATPMQPPAVQEGIIPIHKELYRKMCRDLQMLIENNRYLENESNRQQEMISHQEDQITSLSDKIVLMRERIRESRDHLARYRKAEATPRSVYNTPSRVHAGNREQPSFAALLQASEMASQETAQSEFWRGPGGRKGHTRNAQSLSSLPATPRRAQKMEPQMFRTPQGRQLQTRFPSTAPLPRTSAARLPNVYAQPSLPVGAIRVSQSEGTVTASESNDNDSEAETDIIEQDEIDESQASRAALQMLRSSQDQQVKRDSFRGSNLLGEKTKQTKLSGTIRKANVDRDGEPPAKRARTGELIGLGIAGVK